MPSKNHLYDTSCIKLTSCIPFCYLFQCNINVIYYWKIIVLFKKERWTFKSKYPKNSVTCNVCRLGYIWAPDSFGPHSFWPLTHLGPNSFGPRLIWAPTHLGPNSFGPRLIWAPTHLGPYSFGPQHIWAPTHLGPDTFGPQLISEPWDIFQIFQTFSNLSNSITKFQNPGAS